MGAKRSSKKLACKRVLLKLSGEALAGAKGFGFDPETLERIASDIAEAAEAGVEIGIVIGGGNFFRGAALSETGIRRVPSDHVGMLATLMNSLIMREALEARGVSSVVLSAFHVPGIADSFSQRRLEASLEEGKTILFAGGTGNPFLTTDTAAALRAREMKCDAIFKATQADGVYDSDPKKNPEAKRFERISHAEALERNLAIMDASALALAREARIPIMVFSIHERGEFSRILNGGGYFTRISE